MKIFRSEPPTGKPLKIICTGCGKKAFEAGIAVKSDAVEEGSDTEGPVMMINEDDVHPLCEECVTVLLRSGSGR